MNVINVIGLIIGMACGHLFADGLMKGDLPQAIAAATILTVWTGALFLSIRRLDHQIRKIDRELKERSCGR